MPLYFFPPGHFLPFAEAIKETASIPVFVGGRLKNHRLADKVLKDDKADFIYKRRGAVDKPNL